MVPAMPPQRVEIVIGARTLLPLLGVGLLVVLAILSLGTLLSIFLAAVLAFGLDPVVGSLVRRGWGRGRAALVVFGGLLIGTFALVLVTIGPVWDQIEEFIRSLPQLWEEVQQEDWFQKLSSTGNFDEHVKNWLTDLAKSLPDAAHTLLGAAGGSLRSRLDLVPLNLLG